VGVGKTVRNLKEGRGEDHLSSSGEEGSKKMTPTNPLRGSKEIYMGEGGGEFDKEKRGYGGGPI